MWFTVFLNRDPSKRGQNIPYFSECWRCMYTFLGTFTNSWHSLSFLVYLTVRCLNVWFSSTLKLWPLTFYFFIPLMHHGYMTSPWDPNPRIYIYLIYVYALQNFILHSSRFPASIRFRIQLAFRTWKLLQYFMNWKYQSFLCHSFSAEYGCSVNGIFSFINS